MPQPTDIAASGASAGDTTTTAAHPGASVASAAGSPEAALAAHGLRLEVLPTPVRPADGSDPKAADFPAQALFTRAVEKGFYEKVPDGKALDQWLGCDADDAKRSLGVYVGEEDPAEREPVGTFVDWASTLTVSPGVELPAWLISNVTVSPGHRRRGILRAMMDRSLADAAAAGMPVAALTVSESAIYGRFGFGACCHARRAWVRTTGHVEMRGPAATGAVTREDPREVIEEVDALQRELQLATPGSPRRPRTHRLIWSDSLASENDGKGDGSFVALYRDTEGTARGAVVYRFKGWEAEPPAVRVQAFIAADPEAWRGLVRYLLDLDLIERVEFGRLPDDGALQAALANARLVKVTDHWDDLYLRILDVKACLEGRAYVTGVAGELTLAVTDRQGYAHGTWRLTVADGTGRVERLADGPEDGADLALDVAALSGLWLGGTSAVTGVRTGAVCERSPGAAVLLDTLLTSAEPVHLLTGF